MALSLSPRDAVRVVNVSGRYAVAVVLAPGPRPTSQTDDLDESLVHAARFKTYAAALRLCARVVRAGRIDAARWTWTPRPHGRLVAEPIAQPYNVEA